MGKNVQELVQNLKVAEKLVSNLSLLDGSGYDKMGLYSQLFLTDVAGTGTVSREQLDSYIFDFRQIVQNVEWIREDAKQNAENWLSEVVNYRNAQTSENAQTLLSV